MKRYLVFAFDDYYPCGGWEDFIKDFDNDYAALQCALGSKEPNRQIIDLTNGRDIYSELNNQYDRP